MTAKNGMRPVHPGEVLRDELDELGLSANAVVEGTGSAGEPGDDDPERAAGCERRHGAAACAVLRDDAATLVKPAEDLGASSGGGGSRTGDRREGGSKAIGGIGAVQGFSDPFGGRFGRNHELRRAGPGRGKRGGISAIYFLHAGLEAVYMLTAYAKTDRDHLMEADRWALVLPVTAIRWERQGR